MTLLRIIAIAVLTHMAFVAARMTASLYALANHASTFTVGVIMALFALVPMLIGVRAGRWLDATGPWRPTLTGTLLILGARCSRRSSPTPAPMWRPCWSRPP